MDSHDRLLGICGFEPEEAAQYKPILKEGLARLLVTEKDVDFAVTDRLPQCWSIHLKGIRQLLGCWLREYIRIVIPGPGETRLCHTYLVQPGMAYLHSVKLADPAIRIGLPDVVASLVGSGFFNIGWKYVEAAEREGCAVEQITCSLNKIRYGLHVLGIVPRVDASIGFHTFCDDAPLVDQLIHDWDGTVVLNPYRVRDIHFSGDPFDAQNTEYFAGSLRDGHRQLEEVLDIEITPEHQAKARDLFVNLSATIFLPMTVFMKADPLPLNGNDLALALLPVATAFDTGYDRMFEAQATLQAEVTQMMAEGKGVMPKGTPRVSWRLLNPCGCPWIVPMCHELGLAADFMEAFLLTDAQLLKSAEAQMETDMYLMMAKQLAVVSAMGTSLEYLRQTVTGHITGYGIDGLIATCYRPCRCWTAHSHILARLVGEKNGIPCLTPDIDIWVDRGDFPESRMRTMLETFADVVRRSKDRRLKPASQGGQPT